MGNLKRNARALLFPGIFPTAEQSRETRANTAEAAQNTGVNGWKQGKTARISANPHRFPFKMLCITLYSHENREKRADFLHFRSDTDCFCMCLPCFALIFGVFDEFRGNT
ncbi:hypothetical protein [Intestinimonas butyriciproducens]|uniref:hypothetical protein n=1 Tax=Intestinimonas butyriciproducens TaxID=1297617 RepID=UPI001AB0547C|nr:hypothetical protein [Intestinimonas butyriciproducens]MBO3279448.1 hypothetical protein [Intestinimonas butyriciproducens]MBS6522871.1 hypothetical protein [Clostridiales bacterium]